MPGTIKGGHISDISHRYSRPALAAILVAVLGMVNLQAGAVGGSPGPSTSKKLAPEVSPIFSRFVSEKRALAERFSREQNATAPPQFREFFAAASKDDWTVTTNLFERLKAERCTSPPKWSPPKLWGPVHDTLGTYEVFQEWSPKFLIHFGSNAVKSIPSGSIYFGGSEAGRFLVSAFSASHTEGHPFFTLTQNALSDPAYMNYLRAMYGDKINLPDTNQVQKCLNEYTKDAGARLEHDRKFPSEPPQLRRAEDVRMVEGKVQINGPVAVMAIHALIVKDIFQTNPNRGFYLEESYALDWTYPHMTPHQFVFKINRTPFVELPLADIRADRDFWSGQIDAWLGPWLKTNTPLSEVADFVKAAYSPDGPRNFRGDPQFVRDPAARKAFSHFRSSIAGFYAWRSRNGAAAERERMNTEADFAFRQAFAMCPTNAEVILRYSELLQINQRIPDAMTVATTARALAPENPQFRLLLEALAPAKKDTEK
jgi:hypothetical protein